METRSISIPTHIPARHPMTGKPVKIVGITDENTYEPKLVVLVTGLDGTHVEVVDSVENVRR